LASIKTTATIGPDIERQRMSHLRNRRRYGVCAALLPRMTSDEAEAVPPFSSSSALDRRPNNPGVFRTAGRRSNRVKRAAKWSAQRTTVSERARSTGRSCVHDHFEAPIDQALPVKRHRVLVGL